MKPNKIHNDMDLKYQWKEVEDEDEEIREEDINDEDEEFF